MNRGHVPTRTNSLESPEGHIGRIARARLPNVTDQMSLSAMKWPRPRCIQLSLRSWQFILLSLAGGSLKGCSLTAGDIRPMPERFAIVSGILDVFVMCALLVVSAIHANIEDYYYRRTLTREQLDDHFEAIRNEMNIW